MARKYREVTLTPSVLKAEEQYYGHARAPQAVPENDPLGPDEQAFIAARDSFYLALITEAGWPYIQHRGGPAGFLRVLDEHRLAFADYEGNHQLVSVGSLALNDRIALFLMDYPNRARLKLLGHARVEDARQRPELAAQLAEHDPDAPRIERIFLIDVVGFDWNCPQHIAQRFTAAQVAEAVKPLRQRIAELEAQLAKRA
jgi:predicted pyridoxine 5'-phosphate oxidase superfamily flavin-nucleotide-binding protein